MEEVASVAMQLLSKGQGPSSLCPNSKHCHRQTKPTRLFPAQTFYYSHHFHAETTSQTRQYDEEEN